MSSYDDIMAESRRHAALQIRRKNEANAAAWARCTHDLPEQSTREEVDAMRSRISIEEVAVVAA